MSAGKGDSPRPVDGDKYRSNYDGIFKRSSKPETIKVNGFDVPAPLKSLDGFGAFDPIYYPLPSNDWYYHWHAAKTIATYKNLERGIAHATKEAAISHAKAMLGIDPSKP